MNLDPSGGFASPVAPNIANLIAQLASQFQGGVGGAQQVGNIQGNPAFIDRVLAPHPWGGAGSPPDIAQAYQALVGAMAGHMPASHQPAPGAQRGDGSTRPGGFMWGGQLFQPGSGNLFLKWLAAHGVNAQTWATMHPQAAQMLGITRPGRQLGSTGAPGGI